MEPFGTHTGVGVPLRRSNVDTDQIIPAVYLKRVSRTGFADGLFASWRADPAFVLNQEPYAAGSVLVAGPDFGTGSSCPARCGSGCRPRPRASTRSSPRPAGSGAGPAARCAWA